MPALTNLKPRYDVVVIGGGVHGAAAAQEATRRGHQVLLVERGDFCAGTSANSLKIIHGGLRYLQTLSLRRSRESALEQSRLLQRAPHLVEPLACVAGTESSIVRGRTAMAMGLWFYDTVIRHGLRDLPRGRLVGTAEAARLAGADLFRRCRGAALWYDARARDTERLVLARLKTAERAGARILNYVSATGVDHDGAVTVTLEDAFTAATTRVTAGAVIDTASLLAPHRCWVRAANLVLKRPVLDCAVALRLPHGGADAGRLFFATPHRDAVIIGTWYFADRQASPEKLSRAELNQCLADAGALLPELAISERDVSCVHVGRLPARGHTDPRDLLEQPVIAAVGGDPRVVSVTGVKYTTAGPAASQALHVAGLAETRGSHDGGPWYGAEATGEAVSAHVRHRLGARLEDERAEAIIERLCRQYGATAMDIARLAPDSPDGLERIPGCDAINAEIGYCIDHEHCRTVSDFLQRRSGLGSVAAPPPEAAAYCAEVMARRFGWRQARVRRELDDVDARYQHVAAEH